MANILGVGVATVDIVNVTDGYPLQDTEVRAVSQETRRGGNTVNTLVVLSQLGHQCSWVGTVTDDDNHRIVQQDLTRYGINTQHCQLHAGKSTPTSYITLNRNNGSRTIVHYRELPELDATPFTQLDLSPYQWLHFEARNIQETRKMLEYSKSNYPEIPVSIEIEKNRDDIESLFTRPLNKNTIYFFSHHFAQQKNIDTAENLLTHYQKRLPDNLLVCTWGTQGAFAIQNDRLYHAKAYPPPCVIDTIGAGDTFNAGFINASLANHNTQKALDLASQLAGKKCGISGLHNISQS